MLSKVLSWLDYDVLPDYRTCSYSNDWLEVKEQTLFMLIDSDGGKVEIGKSIGREFKNIHSDEMARFINHGSMNTKVYQKNSTSPIVQRALEEDQFWGEGEVILNSGLGMDEEDWRLVQYRGKL